jgi:lipopolysaccharide assembly outer membrane protein LptD (OstA)
MNKSEIIFSISFILLSFRSFAQNKQQIEIIHTDILEYNKKSGTEAKKLIGNVLFRHQNATMACDSAYFYTDENIVDAFGNVSIDQADTVHLYGKTIHYDGNSKLVQIRQDVRLVDRQATLSTDYLDYDIGQSLGYYFNGGNIVNGNNNLKSKEGQYNTATKTFFFKDNVEIINPQYTIYSDTLKYNTVSRTAFFVGPTRIISKTNLIYCENGWYNTKNNTSKFYKNAYFTGGKRYLRGDSLFYDRNKATGKAYHKIELIDSTQKIILSGNYAYYVEKPEYALITDSAVLTLYNDKDSLYLHADTLKMTSLMDSADHKLFRAYYKVKFFKSDLQGMSDSIAFSTIDSTLRMFHTPVLWTGNNQIFADNVELHFVNQKINTVDFLNNSFIIAKEDTNKFSQVKGKNMKGYFKNNQLSRLFVSGNGQTIYYVKDKEKLIGVNRAVCSQINVLLVDQKINRIIFLTQPDATFYPINKIPEEEKKLNGFIWYENQRPLTKYEIFK